MIDRRRSRSAAQATSEVETRNERQLSAVLDSLQSRPGESARWRRAGSVLRVRRSDSRGSCCAVGATADPSRANGRRFRTASHAVGSIRSAAEAADASDAIAAGYADCFTTRHARGRSACSHCIGDAASSDSGGDSEGPDTRDFVARDGRVLASPSPDTARAVFSSDGCASGFASAVFITRRACSRNLGSCGNAACVSLATDVVTNGFRAGSPRTGCSPAYQSVPRAGSQSSSKATCTSARF